LLSAGADVNAKTLDGDTALMLAARTGHAGIVQALLFTGADVEAKNRYGETAVMLAAEEGHLDIVRMLLKPRK
jgi:hypothetical protein